VIFGQHVHLTLINPCDFFFWDCLKDKICNSSPRKEEDLKENIRKEITNIPAKQLQPFRQCEECLRAEGRHFQHFLWPVNKRKNFLLFRNLSPVRHADSSAKFICD
jgi:hypothetical protein